MLFIVNSDRFIGVITAFVAFINTAKHRLNARNKNHNGKRLCDIIIRAAVKPFNSVFSGKGDAKICLKNSVGQKLKIYVSDTKIMVDRTMAGYKEFSEHFMTEKYSISTAARKKDGAWNLELVFDVSILELFAEDGVDAISTVVYPETPYDRVSWKGDLSVELYEIDA